ncbi:biopolymer transporter ExbD [Caulobacter sp. SLTY]|uniref:ExbD/TolR family protein n=1 Tax=Caulobacter sp. SLTY TaxID=2683262 RepID=UPI0014125BDB|nr:biopolymer transporter ExbD [Caulobacter sp. SLTY]NBB15112.1 biopolymer transporter ExbD [Caulobacter sp. SLTY]
MAAKLATAGSRRWGPSQNAEINVTPFVDVMLVLLIIFMVAAPMATVSIAVDLPVSEAPRTPQPPKPTIVSLQKSGAVYIGERATSLDRLTGDLPIAMREAGIAGLPQGQRIVVRADAEVRYEQFMGVMNALQQGGFYKVDLMTEELS